MPEFKTIISSKLFPILIINVMGIFASVSILNWMCYQKDARRIAFRTLFLPSLMRFVQSCYSSWDIRAQNSAALITFVKWDLLLFMIIAPRCSFAEVYHESSSHIMRCGKISLSLDSLFIDVNSLGSWVLTIATIKVTIRIFLMSFIVNNLNGV